MKTHDRNLPAPQRTCSFKCSFCSQMFAQKFSVVKHHNTEHPDQIPVICVIRDKNVNTTMEEGYESNEFINTEDE